MVASLLFYMGLQQVDCYSKTFKLSSLCMVCFSGTRTFSRSRASPPSPRRPGGHHTIGRLILKCPNQVPFCLWNSKVIFLNPVRKFSNKRKTFV